MKLIKEGNPLFAESLNEILKVQKEGNMRAMAVVYITNDDYIKTDWVRNDGSSVCELSGAVGVLQNQLIERMRGI